jgi:multiple sugar transport system ATP-binding protein
MSASAVEIISLQKTYGNVPVLRDINLSVAEGEFVSLLGPSGCGKSTLLRLLAGLDAPDSGEITMQGRRVNELAPKDRNVAMVFQNYALYPHMTVEQNIALPLKTQRFSSFKRLPFIEQWWPGHGPKLKAIAKEVDDVASSLQLTPLLHRKPGQLSGGQRQRVALARAMVRHPSIFLMDEPLSNLDAKLRLEVRDELAELHQRLGVSFLYVTHDQTEALTLSHKVALMSEGRILQFDRPERLYTHPANLTVAQFIGTPAINTWADEHRPGFTLAIRPENVHLQPAQPSTQMITRDAQIVRIENHGADCVVQAQTSTGLRVLAKVPSKTIDSNLHLGANVVLGWYVNDLLVFNSQGNRVEVA